MVLVLLVMALGLFGVRPVLALNTKEATSVAVVSISSESDVTALKQVIENQKIDGFFGINILKYTIRRAIENGVSPDTLVVLFLFPLVAAMVAFSRQIVGVSGFGVMIPSLLSIAFLSTGAPMGLILMIFVLLVAMGWRTALKKVRIPYLPKLSMLIWFISLSVLLFLVLPLQMGKVMAVGVFPILLFVLLSESFIEAQITRSMKDSLFMTVETIVIALLAYVVISNVGVQSTVLLHPEVSVVLILAIDYLIGRYEGLRLLEVWRFRKLLNK